MAEGCFFDVTEFYTNDGKMPAIHKVWKGFLWH